MTLRASANPRPALHQRTHNPSSARRSNPSMQDRHVNQGAHTTQRSIYDPSLDWDDEDLHSVELSAREWDAILAALQNTELQTHTDPGTIIALTCEQLPEEILEDTPEPGDGSQQQQTLPRQPNAGTLEPLFVRKPTVDELMGWMSGNPDSSTAGSRHAASETSHDAPPTMVRSACGSAEVF